MLGTFWSRAIECFGAAITKKTAFFAQEWPKNANFWPETAFFGPEWSVVGPHTLFSGCWTQNKALCKVLEQIIKDFRAAITKKTHLLAKNDRKKPIFGLKQCFWGLSGHR